MPGDPTELDWFGMRLMSSAPLAERGTSFLVRVRPSPSKTAASCGNGDLDGSAADIARYLAYLAQRRWQLACTTPILVRALPERGGPLGPSLARVVPAARQVGTLGAFAASEQGQMNLFTRKPVRWIRYSSRLGSDRPEWVAPRRPHRAGWSPSTRIR